MMSNPRLCAVLVLTAALTLAGCANSLLYNEARDKQGQSLEQSVAAVDLSAAVAATDRQFAALRQLEVETLRARQLTNLNFEMAKVASAGATGSETLQARYVAPLLDKRIERLLGQAVTTADLDSILERLAEDAALDTVAASQIRAFNAMSGLALEGCADVGRLSSSSGELDAASLARVEPKRRAAAKALFQSAAARCGRDKDRIAELVQRSSLLSNLVQKRDDAVRQADDYNRQLRQQQARLAAEQAVYDAEVKQLEPRAGDAGYKARLMAAAERLQARIEALRKAQAAASSFAHAEALEKDKAIDHVLQALASGVSDPSQLSADQLRAVALVRLIPSIADEADKLFKEAKRPRLGPLLLAKEQQRLIVEAFAARVALLERRVDIREKQLAAARNEVVALSRARRALGPPKQGAGATVDLQGTVATAMADGTPRAAQRAALYTSFAYYFDHAHRYRVEQESLELAANGITDEIVMQESRSAAQMWQSLMTNMAAMLGDYHAAGIKPADLAEFLKGLGVFYLGYQAGK